MLSNSSNNNNNNNSNNNNGANNNGMNSSSSGSSSSSLPQPTPIGEERLMVSIELKKVVYTLKLSLSKNCYLHVLFFFIVYFFTSNENIR